jgi:hypothetical protein
LNENEIVPLVRGLVFNSAAFQVDSSMEIEWNDASIYRWKGKVSVIKVVCMELDMHCMGLHDHSKGPNSMPNAL